MFHSSICVPIYSNGLCIEVFSIVEGYSSPQQKIQSTFIYPPPVFSKARNPVINVVNSNEAFSAGAILRILSQFFAA